MGTSNYSDDFKRDAVAQITERGYPGSGSIPAFGRQRVFSVQVAEALRRTCLEARRG